MPFPYETLDVYKKSLKFVASIESLVSSLKGKASYNLRDQLSRASLSVPLNIAEGYGRWNLKERIQFGRISRGSAFECAAVLQVLYEMDLTTEAQFMELYMRIEEVAKMLTGWVRSLEQLSEAS